MLATIRVTAALLSSLVVAVGSAKAQSLAWTATYDGGPTRASSYAVGPHGLKTDAQGNTYVLGGLSAGTTSGFLTKYGPSGEVIWSRRNEDTADAFAVLVDESGLTTVHTPSASFGYDGAGQLVWRVPHGLEFPWVRFQAAAATPGGGSCLAGHAQSDFGSDLAAACFDGAGRSLWLSRWSGPRNHYAMGQSIGVDAGGRVYVTGSSETYTTGRPGTFRVHSTVAFAADGRFLWARSLDTPEYERPGAFAVDPAGGVSLSVPTGPAALTIKYDANGGTSWSSFFGDSYALGDAAPGFAASAPDGSLYVAGTTSNTGAPFLVRYGPNGAPEWSRVGEGFAAPLSLGLAVDAAGWAAVSWTLKSGQVRTSVYDASGAGLWSADFVWTTTFPSQPVGPRVGGVALGSSGEVRIVAWTGQTPGGLVTLAYAGAGTLQWTAEPLPTAPSEVAQAARVDGAGNVVVLSSGFADGQGLFRTLKYDPSGQLLWSRTAFNTDYLALPEALAVSTSGETVAVGATSGVLAAVKYDAAGSELWSRTFQAPGLSWAQADGVVVDPAGAAYVAGLVYGGQSVYGQHVVLLKYSANGVLQWSRIHPLEEGGPVHLALSSGGALVVGATVISSNTYQYHVFAVDLEGNPLWDTVGDDPSGTRLSALTLGPLGEVIIGDAMRGSVFKLSPAGAPAWSHGSFAEWEQVTAVSVDPTGDTAVAYGATAPCRVAKLSSSGDTLWSSSLREVVGDAECNALRSGVDGRVYVAGYYWTSALERSREAFVAAFDAAGQLRWARRHAGSRGGPAAFNDLDLDGAGRLVAAGYASNDGTSYDALVQSMNDEPARPLAFHTVPPCRAFDSRDDALGGPAAVPANRLFEAQVAGRCGIPATARSVALNLTVTGASDAGYVTLFPAGRVPPPTSSINYSAAITRANQAVVGLGDGGRIAVRPIQGSGSVHMILDLSGYFE